MEYQPYRFTSLESIPRDQVTLLNRANRFLVTSETQARILKSVSETFLAYDIYNVTDMEIGLLVKPAGNVSKPQFFQLKKPAISVGRINENDISLKSPLVSKKHAEIFLRGTEYYLKDLGSNNGTLLNQVKLSPGAEVLLKNDDTIRIEPFEIVVGLSVEVSKRPLEFTLQSVRVAKEVKASGQIQTFFQIQPSNQTAVLLMDQAAARWMVQKIITGHKESALSPWTEIETGLLEYLACKVFSVVNPALNGSRLLFESVQSDSGVFQQWAAKQEKFVELVFGAQTEIGMLYGIVYLPVSIIPEKSPLSPVEELFNKAEWLRNLKYLFSVNLGVSLLLQDQISALDEGDIILLDRSEISLDKNGPKGKIELRSEGLQRGTIRGSLLCDEKGNSLITIESLYQEGLKSMTEANKKTEEAPANPAEEVVSGIEIPVTVEFARVNFTLEEISSLKEGQIIEMEKSQSELVDLSVDGKVIANGKLVDVEGKLGVRLMKVMKGK